jgi:hypothetical protein
MPPKHDIETNKITGETTMKLTLDLTERQAFDLGQSADNLKTSKSEVIRRALSLFLYVQDNIEDNELSLVDKSGGDLLEEVVG